MRITEGVQIELEEAMEAREVDLVFPMDGTLRIE